MVAPAVADILRASETVGVLGEDVPSHGVEARVVDLQCEFADSGYGDARRWSATLAGERVFERSLVEDAPPATLGAGDTFTAMSARWLDLGLSDQLSAARSPSRAVELASRELEPLVRTWIELARGEGLTLYGKSRSSALPRWGGVSGEDTAERASAVERMLSDLGELPSAAQPSERALYVASLINPYGSREWPVVDIRAAVLTATTPLERLSVAKTGIIDSIYKLKGGQWPMNSYYW